MALTAADIKQIAHLARLNIAEHDIPLYTEQLSRIVDFVEQMNAVPIDFSTLISASDEPNTPLRADTVTEIDQRELLQSIAPHTAAGLYLVPSVLDDKTPKDIDYVE